MPALLPAAASQAHYVVLEGEAPLPNTFTEGGIA